MKRRALLSGAAAAALLSRVTRAAPLRAFGGELVAALLESPPATLDRGNPRTLDPFLARTRLEREIAAALHLPLIGGASPGKPWGPLVESVSAMGRAWTLELRRNLAFHDGAPILAQHAVASLHRMSAGSAAIPGVESVEAPNDRTVVITTRRPFPALPAFLAACAAPLVSSAPGDPFYGPIGCGAFMPGAPGGARPNGDVVLAANVRSPSGRAYLDRLVLTALPDSSALAMAIRKGQIDVATATSTTAQISGAGLVSADASATIVLAISPSLAPGALRPRIAGCPNRALLANVFLKGRVKPAATILPPALLGSLADAPALAPPAPRKGSKTRLSLLVTNASSEMREVAERLVWDLHENADVTATIGWRHPSDLESEVAKARYDLLLFEWAPSLPDAGWALAAEQALLHPESAGAELAADDLDARTRAARVADDVLRAGGSLVPIVHPVRLLRVASRVLGVTPDAHGQVSWADVSLQRGRL